MKNRKEASEMKILKLIFLIFFILLFSGCINFTRYKTGKVLKANESRTTIGEAVIKKDCDGSGAGILPKITGDFGIGNGFEIDVTCNLFLIGIELRKQILYENRHKINLAADMGINKGVGTMSIIKGVTISKTLKNEAEPYIGVYHNKNINKEIDVGIGYMELVNPTNIQTTIGIKNKLTDKWSLYTELNIFRYLEKVEEFPEEKGAVVFGTGISTKY